MKAEWTDYFAHLQCMYKNHKNGKKGPEYSAVVEELRDNKSTHNNTACIRAQWIPSLYAIILDCNIRTICSTWSTYSDRHWAPFARRVFCVLLKNESKAIYWTVITLGGITACVEGRGKSSDSSDKGGPTIQLLRGVGGWFLVIKNFFSTNLVGRIFFSLLNALQDIFFPPHFSAGFFFPQKRVMCLHIQNVFTLTLWSLQ